ncbi:unnamed protein product [Spodoptera littoralis]|uniref:Uncharacterized protein n=1 Tax=Spodoptera littoralis TaxID=7109 RepID=A0A9P0HZY9_SPOLI|nr:unnamed protein product [Spodoptera littoralis]CAH1637105.1 unnamed protein product [Spodoptera littoralis]
MAAIKDHQGGTLVGSNPNMRRAIRSQAHAGTAVEDDAYRRTREKNNAAAKKSRAAPVCANDGHRLKRFLFDSMTLVTIVETTQKPGTANNGQELATSFTFWETL